MTEAIRNALLDLKARQEAGEHMPCPRCGRNTMKPALVTNALSRHADGIFVCDDCGTAEALLQFMQNPLPIECWAFLRTDVPESFLTDMTGEAAWQLIREKHLPKLMDIFKRWKTKGTNFQDLRVEAFRSCPGLTQIWEEPFQVLYTVADGEFVLRFRERDGTIEVATNLLRIAK